MRRRQRRWGRLTFSQAGEGGESGADGHGRELLFRRHFFCGRGFGVGARETLEEQPRSASEAAASFFLLRTLNYAIFRYFSRPTFIRAMGKRGVLSRNLGWIDPII